MDDLSKEFMEKAVSYDRNLHVEGKDSELFFSLKDDRILPFYTPEGAILFIDFLEELAGELGVK